MAKVCDDHFCGVHKHFNNFAIFHKKTSTHEHFLAKSFLFVCVGCDTQKSFSFSSQQVCILFVSYFSRLDYYVKVNIITIMITTPESKKQSLG
jgi:hypothetical protein